MRPYEKPAYLKGPMLHAVTAQLCISPFVVNCFVEDQVE